MPRIVFTLEDGTRIESELDSVALTIGRHPESRVVLPSASVSIHHATIKRKGEDYVVQDLGTTNGTKLNGVEVEEAKLADGDELTFGDVPAVIYWKARPPAKSTSSPGPAAASAPVPAAPPARPAPPAAPPRAAAPQVAMPPPLFDQPSAVPVPVGAPRPAVRRPPGYTPRPYKGEGGGCAGFFLLMVFLVLAFFAGLCIRHYNETKGGNLPMDIFNKYRGKFGLEKHDAPGK